MEGTAHGTKRRREVHDNDLSTSDRAALSLLSELPELSRYKRDKRGRRGAVFIGDPTSDRFLDALTAGFGKASTSGEAQAETHASEAVFAQPDPAQNEAERPALARDDHDETSQRAELPIAEVAVSSEAAPDASCAAATSTLTAADERDANIGAAPAEGIPPSPT
jgi:hypothetical protein